MSLRHWCIGGCVGSTEEYLTLENALGGGQLNKAILRPSNYDTVDIAKVLLSLDKETHRRIAAECEKLIAAKMQTEHDKYFTPPNYGEIQTVRVRRTAQESYGFLGLKKKTVTKEENVPSQKFAEFLQFLNQESFFSLNSFRSEREEPGVDIEYDNAYLLTDTGRFLNLVYEVAYMPSYNTNFKGYQEIPYNDKRANLLLAGNISRYIGLDAFKEMCGI